MTPSAYVVVSCELPPHGHHYQLRCPIPVSYTHLNWIINPLCLQVVSRHSSGDSLSLYRYQVVLTEHGRTTNEITLLHFSYVGATTARRLTIVLT